MERDTYRRSRRALSEAYEILDTVATTSSLPVASAACRRALHLFCLLDHELNGTVYPPDFAAGPTLAAIRAHHPGLFEHESVLHPSMILPAVEWCDDLAFPDATEPEPELERVFLPAARSIRLLIDEASTGLRDPGRWGWRAYTALVGAGAALIAIPWVCMLMSSEGLTVTYYHGMSFKRPIARVVEKQVTASYGDSMFSLSQCRFSSRWQGTLVAPVTANYSFYCQSDGGVRMTIDGTPVLNNWRNVSWKASGTHGEKRLDAGEHKIVIEYFKEKGHGGLRLRWAGGPIPDNTALGTPYLKR